MLTALLRYFADVAASVDGSFTPHVGNDVVLLEGGGRPHPDDMPQLRKLAAVDKLHKEEHLLRVGRYWLMGEFDGVEYRWPIIQQSAQVNLLVPSSPVLTRPDLHPWLPTPGLVSHDAQRELAEVAHFMGTLAEPTADRVTGNYPKLFRALTRHQVAAGLPELPILTWRGHRKAAGGSEPYILAARGLYLAKHPFALDRVSALKLWAGEDVEGTALHAIYDTHDSAEDPGGNAAPTTSHDRIQSPLPLNAPQRSAIESSQIAPLTVIAGPPGTGKSHLVAATAIDRVAAGQSVLIATQSIHACDVIHELLERYPMVDALRFGDDISARRIGDLLAAGVPAPDQTYDPERLHDTCSAMVSDIDRQRGRISERVEQLGGFEQALVRQDDLPLWLRQRDLSTIDVGRLRSDIEAIRTSGMRSIFGRRQARQRVEHDLGRSADQLGDGGLDSLVDAIEAQQLVDAASVHMTDLDELWDELERSEDRWRHTIGDLLEALRRDRANRRNRSAVHELASSLRLGAARRRSAMASVSDEFLEAIPLWIGTLSEIESILPVRPGLFDLVILDEASQISQLSAVPALARGRRAMVVGDSRQLRHTSDVTEGAQADAARRFEIPATLAVRVDDRTNSIFDAATAVAPVITLDEHFRSAPHIIGFSDRQFYGGQLRLMTQHPRTEARDAIGVLTVQGYRDQHGVVPAEVDAAMDRIRQLMAHGVQSIGVVSPSKMQAEAIEEAILAAFTLEQIENHRLRVGTVESFQGSEREYVIICLGAGSSDDVASSVIEDPAIFNVMVTRARTNVDVITTLDRASAGSGLLGQYLRHADEPPRLRNEHVRATGWTERVARELTAGTDQRIITGYEVAGDAIDIVIGTGPGAFALETQLHPQGAQAHIERHLALRRAGWRIESFYRSMFYGREEEAIAGLLARLAGPTS